MNRRLVKWSILLAVIFLSSIISPCLCRADTIYTDRATWTAASTGITDIDFEGIAPPGSWVWYDGSAIGGVTFTAVDGSSLFVVDPAFYPPLYDWGSGAVFSPQWGSPTGVIASLPSGVTSLALDLMTIGPAESYGYPVDILLSDGTHCVVSTFDRPNRAFFGVVSSTDITSIQITSEVFPILDNFSYGSPVPEPGTLALFGTGLLAVARKIRKRRAA
jgi:hypothetical protein